MLEAALRDLKQSNPIDLAKIREWVREAARMVPGYQALRPAPTFKNDGTPTTAVDLEIERFLVSRIRQSYPAHRILAEEEEQDSTDSDFLWVIDPLDGTRAYASGLPIWGISVGVLHDGKPVAGAFYLPAVNELYWGSKDGAFLNGQPLVRPAASIDDPLTFLAVPSDSHLVYDISFGRLRSLGSTAAHLIYVARGAAIGALTRRVKIWDLAGVLPILEDTGISLRYLSGAPFHAGDLLDGEPAPEPLLAAPAHLLDPLLAMIHLKP